MINNQRGGIISKLFIIPIGVCLMAGFFFLGYYVGKYQSKTNRNEIVVPLPDVVSENLPKEKDFTFFKTLSDKGNKTVSIELKPNQEGETPGAKEKAGSSKKESSAESRPDKTATSPGRETIAKKEQVVIRESNPKMRYTLQLASYQEREMAEADVKKMKQRGYAAFMVASEVAGKGTWFRVRLGSYSSKASAEKMQKEVQAKEGITTFITLE
jgi:cell division septation protein DedD